MKRPLGVANMAKPVGRLAKTARRARARRATVCIAIIAGAVACLATPRIATAQESIGSTAIAHNEVVKDAGGGAIAQGDSVFLNEAVRTGADSAAKFVFKDSTNLAMGAVARAVLDKFVYDPSPSNQAMAVGLAKGVFRFTTGQLDKRAYTIQTPTANIGVRGTVLDIDVEAGRSRVTLREGDAIVCPRDRRKTFAQQQRECGWPGQTARRDARHPQCECVDLDRPGMTAAVAQTGAATLTSSSVQFAALCAGDQALCSDDTFAQAEANAAALCGR